MTATKWKIISSILSAKIPEHDTSALMKTVSSVFTIKNVVVASLIGISFLAGIKFNKNWCFEVKKIALVIAFIYMLLNTNFLSNWDLGGTRGALKFVSVLLLKVSHFEFEDIRQKGTCILIFFWQKSFLASLIGQIQWVVCCWNVFRDALNPDMDNKFAV